VFVPVEKANTLKISPQYDADPQYVEGIFVTHLPKSSCQIQ